MWHSHRVFARQSHRVQRLLAYPWAVGSGAWFSTSWGLAERVDAQISDLNNHATYASMPKPAHNFSFSGCGFLISYHLGVAQGMKELGFLQPSASKVAGASGGAIVALSIASDQDLYAIHEEAKSMAHLCRQHGVLWKLEARLRQIFAQRFANVSVDALGDRLIIATQQMWPKRMTVHSDKFASAEELCDAIIASCYIPMYLAPQLWVKYRGELHIDGGIVRLVPEVPGYIKVCAFHAHWLRRDDYEISPSLDPEFPYNILELGRFALFPPDPVVLEELFHYGRKAAVLWASKQTTKNE